MTQVVGGNLPFGANCGGINTYADPRALADNEMTKGTNLFPNTQGLLETRPAVAFDSYAFSSTNPVTFGFALANRALGVRYVAASYDVSSKNSKLYAWSPGIAAISIPLTNPLTQRVRFVNIGQDTICFPCNGEEGFYALTLVGATPTWVKRSFTITALEQTHLALTSAQSQTKPLAPQVAFTYLGGAASAARLFIANFGPGYETSFTMSDFEYPLPYTPDGSTYLPYWTLVGSDILAFNSRRGFPAQGAEQEKITAGCQIQLQSTGTPVQSGALLCTNKGAYIATGGFLETTDSSGNAPSGDFQLARMNFECGCVGADAICRTPYGVFWAARDDVWFLGMDGRTPTRIGTKIRDQLLSCPTSEYGRWTMTYFDGVLRLGICRSTPSGNVSVGDWNADFDYWWLDLREAGIDGSVPNVQTAHWFRMHYSISQLSALGEDAGGPGLGLLLTDDNDTKPKVCALVPQWDGAINVVDVSSTKSAFDLSSKRAMDPMVWTTLTNWRVGDVVLPTTPTGRFFACTISGLGGASEPSWPGSGTVADGAATWTEMSTAGDSHSIGMPISMVNFDGATDTRGNVNIDGTSKEYDYGDLVAYKTIDYLDLTLTASERQQLVVEYDQDMVGQVETDAPDQYGSESNALPFQLGTQLIGNRPITRSFRSGGPTGVIRARTLRYRIYDKEGFVVDSTNQLVTFGGTKPIVVTVPTGAYTDVDALLAAVAAATQVEWRLTGFGASGTVGYTSGNNSGFPSFARWQPCKLVWSGFDVHSETVNLQTAGCLSLVGFENPARCGSFVDNGNLYGSNWARTTNPVMWSFVGGTVKARSWAARALTKSDQ